MARPSLQRTLLAGVLLVASALAAAAGGDTPRWGYHGRNGTQAWGDLAPGFAVCKLGQFQAPIDIRTADAKKAPLPPIKFSYAPARAVVVNNGHSIQVEIPAGGKVTLEDDGYTLEQFHFHAPSEEKIDGKPYAMVAHLVYRNAQDKLAVVAVLMKQGRANAALAPVFDNMPGREGGKHVLKSPLNLAGLLPADRAYYRFKGSLTTPPCSEQVSWQVLKQPVEISKEQLAAFRKLYPMNARPTQPLNGRTVEQN
jgi:carbonic anhydrase